MTLIYLGVGATGVELWICVRVEKLELPCEVRHSPGAAAPRVVRPKAIPLRGDRDHDAFALWVLSSSERGVQFVPANVAKGTGVAAFWGWSRQDSNL